MKKQKYEFIPRRFWERYAEADVLKRRKILQKTVTKSIYRISKCFADIKGKEKEKEDFFNDAITNWIQSYFDDLVELWQEDASEPLTEYPEELADKNDR